MKTRKATGRGVLTTLMIILCEGGVSRAAVASIITQPTETLPGQKIEKVFDTTGFDRVNIFSGDLQLTVPLGPEYPVTAGFSFQLAAHYSSTYWHMVKLECGSTDTCGTDWAARANVMGDSTLGVGWTLGVGYVEETTSLGSTYRWLVDGDGTRRELAGTQSIFEANDGSDIRVKELATGGYLAERPDGSKWLYTQGPQAPVSANDYDFQGVNRWEGAVQARWGLTSVTDRYGNVNVLRVSYKTGDGDRWKAEKIILGGDREITFVWGTLAGWPVVTQVTMPTSGGRVLTVALSYHADGRIRRSHFEGGTNIACPGGTLGPADPNLPLLSRIVYSDQSWDFEYNRIATDSPGEGMLRSVTLPTGGMVEYEYAASTAFVPCIRTNLNCGDPETAPLAPSSENGICDIQWKQSFVEGSAAVINRRESGGSSSETSYARRQVAEKREGVPLNQQDPERTVRIVVVKEDDGNGGKKSRRHVFQRLGGQEVLRRIYANGSGSGDPVRSIVSCWGLWTDEFGTCGTFERDVTANKVKIPAWDGGAAKLMRKVTWYGANPAPVLSGSGRFTGGADCAEAVETACWQGTASGWHNQAREFTMWTTERASESGSSALLFPSDFVRREEKTEYTPDMSLWDLKRVTYSGVKDVYSTGSGCKAEVEPCETGTVYSHGANGFLEKAVQKDIAGARWKLETEYEQEEVTGNARKETRRIWKDGRLESEFSYAVERSYQHGQVVTSKWADMGWKRFDVTRDGVTGWITASRDPEGLLTSYAYDELGRLTGVTVPGEAAQTYCYVVSQSDPSYVLAKKGSSYPCALSEDAAAEGAYEAYQYDGFGRLERTVTRYPVSGGSAFAVRKRTYGAHGAVTFQSERSHCTSGGSPLPCFTANPLTGTSYSDFDAFSRPLKEESGDGYWLKRAYGVNAHGFVDTDMYEWRERTKEASSERYVMSARRTGVFGNVLILSAPIFAATDEDLTLGQLSFLYWNTQGKLTRTETQGSQAPTLAFPNSPGTDSQRRSWHYDASGLLREESCPEEGWTEYLSYDAMGNLLEKTEGGIWSGYHYDAASRLTREEASATGGEEGAVTLMMKTWDTPPGKLTEELAYNPSLDVRYGTSASFWNPGLGIPGTVAVRETYTYSPVSGKLTSRKVTSETGTEYGYRKTGALAATESYGYNALGYVTSETRTGNGWGMGLVEEKSFRYGVPVSVRVKPSDQTTSTPIVTDAAYGPGGALSSYTLGNGSQVSVATDGRNRPVSIVGAGFDSGEMSYDGDGNLKKMGELTYGYDASSRLTSVKEGTLTRETMEYDSFGNLTSRSNGWMGTTEALPASLETNRLVDGTYDARGNLLTMGTEGTETFRYDVAGRKYEYEASGTKMRYLFGPGDERSGKIVLESGEDGVSRRMMARQLVQALGAAPATNCNPAGLTFLDVPCHDPDWGYIQTLYDLRITGGCGNYRSYCPNDLVTREQMAVFIMVVKYFPELVPDPTINPAWQDDPPASSWALKFINRMYQEGITAGCEANPLRFCPKHELKRWQLEIFLTVIVLRLVSLKPSTSYTLRDSGNRVVTEYQDTVRTRDNIYLGNQLMASLRWSWDARTRTWGKAWEYYGSDHLGTPRTVQDALGNLVDRKDYLAFGELRSGPPPSQRKGFALMERDDEGSGKSFYDHARDYHSRLSRFTSPDLLQGTATDPLSWNRYAYARNNPLKYVDRNGKWSAPATAAMNPEAAVIVGVAATGLVVYNTFVNWVQHGAPVSILQLPRVKTAADLARTFTPGGKAPDQVTPGIKEVDGIYDPPDRSAAEPYRAHYDEYGRQVGRTDYTDQPDPTTRTEPHHHTREYGPGYGPKGKETYHEGPHPEDAGKEPPTRRTEDSDPSLEK